MFRLVIVTGNAVVSMAVVAVFAARRERIIIALPINQFVTKRQDYVINLVLRIVLISAAEPQMVAPDHVMVRLIVLRINRIVMKILELQA
jgi:hypothetical protein